MDLTLACFTDWVIIFYLSAEKSEAKDLEKNTPNTPPSKNKETTNPKQTKTTQSKTIQTLSHL